MLFLIIASIDPANYQAMRSARSADGKYTKLVQAGLVVDGCKNLLVNRNYSTGVSSY
jgi:hypothetical protein